MLGRKDEYGLVGVADILGDGEFVVAPKLLSSCTGATVIVGSIDGSTPVPSPTFPIDGFVCVDANEAVAKEVSDVPSLPEIFPSASSFSPPDSVTDNVTTTATITRMMTLPPIIHFLRCCLLLY